MKTAVGDRGSRAAAREAGRPRALLAWAPGCFLPMVLEAKNGIRPPTRYCARDLVAYLRYQLGQYELTYSASARTLLEGLEVIT
jgi:hypothetical protein